jgi:serine/threonine protein kinase
LVFGEGISSKAKDLLSKMLQIKEKDRIDWDTLFKHPIFNGRFKNYIDKNIQLQSKLKYLMS